MWRDPIVEEVRRWREEYAAQFDYDLDAMFRDLREKEERSGRKVVRLPPKRISTAAICDEQPVIEQVTEK